MWEYKVTNCKQLTYWRQPTNSGSYASGTLWAKKTEMVVFARNLPLFIQCHTRAHPESIKCWLVSHQWAGKGRSGKHMAITPSSSRGRGRSLTLQNAPPLLSVTVGWTKGLNSCSGSVALGSLLNVSGNFLICKMKREEFGNFWDLLQVYYCGKGVAASPTSRKSWLGLEQRIIQ